MEQSTELNLLPNPLATTFAGLLSSMVATEQATPETEAKIDSAPAREREDEESLEDMATLSYESALRTHARYKPAIDPVSMPPMPVKSPATVAPTKAPPTAVRLKSASITVRMSETECEQLRLRAAEAGMTVSAYLRSCTFEVEALRAQVKEVMTQLRTAAMASSAPPSSGAVAGASAPVPDAEQKPGKRGFWKAAYEHIVLPRTHRIEQAVRA